MRKLLLGPFLAAIALSTLTVASGCRHGGGGGHGGSSCGCGG